MSSLKRDTQFEKVSTLDDEDNELQAEEDL